MLFFLLLLLLLFGSGSSGWLRLSGSIRRRARSLLLAQQFHHIERRLRGPGDRSTETDLYSAEAQPTAKIITRTFIPSYSLSQSTDRTTGRVQKPPRPRSSRRKLEKCLLD